MDIAEGSPVLHYLPDINCNITDMYYIPINRLNILYEGLQTSSQMLQQPMFLGKILNFCYKCLGILERF